AAGCGATLVVATHDRRAIDALAPRAATVSLERGAQPPAGEAGP
ncbi:ABC transporter, partial [Paracidovorax avenae]